MNKKNKLKAVLAIAVALAFVMPVAAFANIGTIGIISDSENTSDLENIMETGNALVQLTGNIIYVGGTGSGNYSTIQEGVNAATDGDTVYVYNGTYYEGVIVNKQLDLVGESRENVIVDGEGWKHVVKVAVNVNYVSIDTFTMTNGSYGIYLYKSSNCNITNCDSYSNSQCGIWLSNSPNSKLRGNSIYDNVYNFGVATGWSPDIKDFYHDIDASNTVNGKPIRYLVEQSNLTIDNFGYLALISCTNITAKNGDVNDVLVINTTDSTISNVDSHNSRYGIYLWMSPDNNITNCNAYNNNGNGIYLDGSSNCIITNCTASYNRYGGGIHLDNSSNCIIANCNAYNNSHDGITITNPSGFTSTSNNITNCNAYNNNGDGIYFDGSSNNNIIINCEAYNNYRNGIYFDGSSNNNIINCSTYNNSKPYIRQGTGIYIRLASNNNIINCDTYNNNYGIYIYRSLNNNLEDNTIHDNVYDFHVEGKIVIHFHHDIDTSNMINGKPMYYLINQENIILDENDNFGYLGLISCTNITAKNADVNGVLLACTADSTISNVVSHNSRYGIYLFMLSSNNNITNCNAYNNEYGIYLSMSQSNLIYNNYFADNMVNSWDDTGMGNNIWNIAKTAGTNIIGGPFLGGNFWSDYAGEDLYGDGLGDTLLPYTCDDKIKNGGDYLPLVPVEYTLVITTVGSGMVNCDPVGNPPGTYVEGTVVTLTPEPVAGWAFDGWSGPDAGEIVDDKITMTKDMFITAYFTEDHYTLTVSIVGDGHVDVVPDKEYYLYGEEPQLTAVADPGWTFDSWSGDLSGNTNPTTIFMDGNKDVTSTFTEEGDIIPPVTKCIFDPPEPDGDNGWYVSVVNVTLNATDEGSGVNYTMYKLDDGKWITYTDPFNVCEDGMHILYYYSIDLAGNEEPVNEADFKIDQTSPMTTYELEGDSSITVTLIATDETSGVSHTMYKLDDGTYSEYVGPFVVDEEGDHTVCFYSVDNAGNVEGGKCCTFTVTAELTVEISGGLGVTATIKNVGDVDATGVEWSITFDGGFILVPRGGTANGTVDIPAGEEFSVKIFVLGFGKTVITMTANDVEKTADGFVLLFFVLGVQ